jgi:lipopolysaccharide export system permease protein
VLTRLLDYLCAALFGTFQRMIFWELLRVFLLCLFALAGIFTLLAVLQQIQFGVSLGQALKMLPLLVPTSLPWITPPSCLFASCVVYGRMAHDNEAVALKAAGVDLLSVIRPAVALGAVACVFAAYLQFDVTPQAWRGSREVLVEDPEEAIGLVLKRRQTLEFASGNTVMKLSVRDVQAGTRKERVTDEWGETFERDVPEQRLMDVVLKQRKGDARTWQDPDFVARTHSTVLRVEPPSGERKGKVRLGDSNQLWETWVKSDESGGGPRGTGRHVMRPEDSEMDLPPQFNIEALRNENRYNPAMVDWVKLPDTAAEVTRTADEHRLYARRLSELPDRPLSGEEVAAFKTEVGVSPAHEPAARLKQITDEQNQVAMYSRMDRTLRYEYHLRPAIAFGCLLFAVLGCPVGLWANRADYLSIFVICFLPALLVYYPVLFMVGGYARDGKIPMALGVWTANAVLALGTAVLSWRLIRR